MKNKKRKKREGKGREKGGEEEGGKREGKYKSFVRTMRIEKHSGGGRGEG